MTVATTISELRANPAQMRLYLWFFFSRFMLLTPFFAVFLNQRVGADTSQVLLLFSTYTAARVISEVPTGFVADRVGNRVSLVIGSALIALGTGLLVFGPLWTVFIGQVVFAFGESANSGAQEALLYRYTRKKSAVPDDQSAYEHAQGLFGVFGWTGVGVAAFAGYLLAQVSYVVLGHMAFAVSLMAAVIALTLPEPMQDAQTEPDETKTSYRALVRSIVTLPGFMTWFTFGVLVDMILTAGYFLIQPLLSELEIAGPQNGLIYGSVTMFAAFGAGLGPAAIRLFASKQATALAGLALLAAALVLLATAKGIVAVILAMCLYRFTWGGLGVLSTIGINEHIASDELRATTMSVQALTSGLLSTAVLATLAVLALPAVVSMASLIAVVGVAGAISLFGMRKE